MPTSNSINRDAYDITDSAAEWRGFGAWPAMAFDPNAGYLSAAYTNMGAGVWDTPAILDIIIIYAYSK